MHAGVGCCAVGLLVCWLVDWGGGDMCVLMLVVAVCGFLCAGIPLATDRKKKKKKKKKKKNRQWW